MAEKRPPAQALRLLPEEELAVQLQAARQGLWDGRMKAKAGSAKQPHQLRADRRQIARILTVMRERSPQGATEGPPAAGEARHG